MDREKPSEIQERQMQAPAPGQKQPHTPAQAGGWPAGKQPCGKGPGSPGGHQGVHGPAACPGGQEGQ